MIILAFDSLTVISSIVVFLGFNLVLVYIILYAKSKLTPSGLVKIIINGKETLEAKAGSTLLYPQPAVVVEPVPCANAKYYLEAAKFYPQKPPILPENNSNQIGGWVVK
jgi:hypothetical protein